MVSLGLKLPLDGFVAAGDRGAWLRVDEAEETMTRLPTAVLLLVTAPLFARAEDLVVVRPGIMCRSAAALARLTLHGGDSRTHRAMPRAADLTLAGSGGCRDLVLGQKLAVLQSFRNTARVTVDDEVLVVPLIDLGPAAPVAPSQPAVAAMPPSERDARQQDDDPMSDAALNALIGEPEDTFIQTHPGGSCTGQSAGAETCVYPAGNQANCPIAFACTATIYGFDHGRLSSFQTGLQSEDDWKMAYQLALGHYDLPVSASSATGASAFFRTKNGVLGFGHSFAAPGRAPSWAIRYYLPGQGSGPP